MTTGASCIDRLVPNKCLLAVAYSFVAAIAGHLSMSARELEFCISIMIEQVRFPVAGDMAAFTLGEFASRLAGCSCNGELPPVHIKVTKHTVCLQRGEQ